MILQEEVFKIGKFTKTHGIKGEISLSFDNDIFDQVDCPYLIGLIDGIFVPFFIEEYRFKGAETALFLLEDIDNEEKAKKLCGVDVYFPRKYMEDSETETDYSWNYFIGFTVINKDGNELGIIEAIDEATINTLFLIKGYDDTDIIIPATEDFIEQIDDKKKIIYLDLPEGLI